MKEKNGSPLPTMVKTFRAAYRLEHSAATNSETWSHGVLLASRFRFGQDGEYSGKRAARRSWWQDVFTGS